MDDDPSRFHQGLEHLHRAFGADSFGRRAEAFARWFGTPTFMLAQTHQADRNKPLNDADAQHREALAQAAVQRQEIALRQTQRLEELLAANTELTEQVRQLTREIHERIVAPREKG